MEDISQKQNQVQQPANPVGTPLKETEGPVSDYVLPSETTPTIDKEVVEAGVTEVKQTPVLTNDHFSVGIKHSAEATPVQTEPTGIVKLPMEEKEANLAAKGSIGDSKTWWANLIVMIFKKMRLSGSST